MSGKILLCRTCEEPMTVQATADFTAIRTDGETYTAVIK